MQQRVAARAPGRVNLIGEHTDYNGGLCLPIALRQATTASVQTRPDDRVVLRSGDRRWQGVVADLSPGSVEGWAAYVAGVLWALDVRRGLSIDLASELPQGAGLSSSAALECSVAVAVRELLALRLDDDELVRACIRAETEMVGAPTGGLDQTASVLAREGEALLLDFDTGATRGVPWRPERDGLVLLVVDTRVGHRLTDGGYGARRDQAEEAARRLGVPSLRHARDLDELPDPLDRRAGHVLSEIARVEELVAAAEVGNWARVGAIMDASHASLRDDYEVSCPELDVVVGTARRAGALGARMTGGGFGGSAIALVPAARLVAVQHAVSGAFADRGWPRPAYLRAEAGPGASVVTPVAPASRSR
jgi:galactokinase